MSSNMRPALPLLLFATCTTSEAQSSHQWDGEWVARECWEHLSGEFSNCIDYTLNIASDTPTSLSTLSVQGYMISLDAIVEIRPIADGCQILLSRLESEQVSANFSIGTVLFELRTKPTGISTVWMALSPALESTGFSRE